VHMFHKHHLPKKKSLKSLGYMNLMADGIHNFTDGILIAVSWMISYEVGLSTTIAIFIHELPQELSDYGILIKAGFSKSKALLYNLLSAASAILGAVLALLVGQSIEGFAVYLLPVAAGCFIYLSLFSLLPLIVKGNSLRKTLMQILIIVAGVVLMYLVAE
ncbi:MAG: ZIP family metal transporter, partial [Paludibacteraceae bacterium]|nr:ZIP family metal transporter [Paludibacteraceae bacterium]